MKTLRSVMGPARAALILALLGCGAAVSEDPGDSLERAFQNPPDSAKPRVWWHWMNGNITKDGIDRDLAWMKRTGIGGFQNFDAELDTPQIVERRLAFMTPEWKDAFRHAITLADQLGLETAIAASPGWSETGGPWVTPAHAMKKLVWSETGIAGGRPFKGVLPKPPSTTGPFQNVPRVALFAGSEAERPKLPEYYADAAVVAYRVPAGEVSLAKLAPKVTSSAGRFDLAQLTDGDLAQASILPAAPAGQMAWIRFEFAAPQMLRAFTLATLAEVNPWLPDSTESGQRFEASDDGVTFRLVAKVPGKAGSIHTVSFAPTSARFFRVSFPPAAEQKVTELVLHTGARVNRYQVKAGFATVGDLYAFPTPEVSTSSAVRKSEVIDLTGKMAPDGTLQWTPPAGRWIVLRLGYSLTGARNAPASAEATGLEVDKLNRSYVKAYLDTYLDQYQGILGPLMGKRGLRYVVTDSWEAGPQNWTDEMLAEFTKRRGYDPRPWLPVLTGRVVESAEASDRFLWDFRKTIADLTAEYHYDQIGTSLHERGMGRYSESQESQRVFVADGMEVKRNADIPMSAMWTMQPGVEREQYGYNADIRESASVAHIYGQNLVAAESLTAHGTAWQWSPETLKPTADKELAMGLNRFVIHTSVHQPVSDKVPGLGLGPFGQWFTRHETWAEQALPWTTYLARSSFLLQQGKFVADVAYFYGEDSNVTALFSDHSPDVPAGYNYDFMNADALIHRCSVSGGRITTPSGMSYRVLVLDPHSRYMSLPVLRKIRDLVKEGAVVVGSKPVASPSLSDSDAEFRSIAAELWASPEGENVYGQGRVYAGRKVAQVLAALDAPPDFEYTRPQADTNLLFVHRRLPEGEVYWVDSRNPRSQAVEATFRVEGKAAELWHPETGRIEPASYRISGGRTTVPLSLEPNEAVFVVFRQPAAAPSRTVPAPVEANLGTVEGPWKVAFQPDRGAPAGIVLDKLASWNESSDMGVKYFSGTATYTRTLQVSPEWMKPGTRLWLDLGNVKNLAEVTVNGKPLGIVWKTPFRVDVTDAVRP
ncbi:MAG TPA: glycosyl hydrolase, partial [Bryobacteraceae bacterium]|nr:glycosyl hydrolase [Bryobacteraceae bacterium]